MTGISSRAAGKLQNRYKYNGKEEQRQEFSDGAGLDWIDYGARMYDAQIGRWHKQDRFSEKYLSSSPYGYVINNPMKFIDINGDSLNVLEKYREIFMKALESRFGENAKYFGYSQAGNLVYNGDTKKLSKDEQKFLKNMRGLMNEKTITNIIYESKYEGTDSKGNSFVIAPHKSGGEATASTKQNPTLTQNYVLVDPVGKSPITVFETTDEFYKNRSNGVIGTDNFVRNDNVITNPETSTWHGIGHIIYAGKTLNNVIDFDNSSRALNKTKNPDGTFTASPMTPRKYDDTHNKTIIWYGN
ncbi:MAG: hypothetical protein J7621_22970 [Niastella sp.]|nr:hypothetical protein [Niastella sp.]